MARKTTKGYRVTVICDFPSADEEAMNLVNSLTRGDPRVLAQHMVNSRKQERGTDHFKDLYTWKVGPFGAEFRIEAKKLTGAK